MRRVSIFRRDNASEGAAGLVDHKDALEAGVADEEVACRIDSETVGARRAKGGDYYQRSCKKDLQNFMTLLVDPSFCRGHRQTLLSRVMAT